MIQNLAISKVINRYNTINTDIIHTKISIWTSMTVTHPQLKSLLISDYLNSNRLHSESLEGAAGNDTYHIGAPSVYVRTKTTIGAAFSFNFNVVFG